jgi:uncharacterized membrane protein YuzA (DUF378 family)
LKKKIEGYGNLRIKFTRSWQAGYYKLQTFRKIFKFSVIIVFEMRKNFLYYTSLIILVVAGINTGLSIFVNNILNFIGPFFNSEAGTYTTSCGVFIESFLGDTLSLFYHLLVGLAALYIIYNFFLKEQSSKA